MTEPNGDHEAVEPIVKNPMLSDKMYKILEYTARVILPGLATLYMALTGLWSLPYGPQVVGTIVAVDTFLGLFLGVAQRSYDDSDAPYDGSIDVIQQQEGTLYSLNLDSQPEALANMEKVTFKVNPSTNP